MAAAFREIGDRWSVRQALRSTKRDAVVRSHLHIMHELRSILPAPLADAPLAIGGTTGWGPVQPGDDDGRTRVARCKVERGLVGDNLPFETLAAAIKEQQPKLFWLSCSYIANEGEFLSGYRDLYDQFGMDVAFVVGGYALTEQLRQKMKFSSYCDNMQHLEGFAQTLRSAIGE